MVKKIKIICGIAVFAFALAFNLQYALDDYSLQNNLFMLAMAQTNTGGNSGGNGGDTKKVKICYCTDKNNYVTGYGNKCIVGSGSCVPTTCTGTPHCSE